MFTKNNFKSQIGFFSFSLELSVIANKWNDDCKGDLQNCSFIVEEKVNKEPEVKEETKTEEIVEESQTTLEKMLEEMRAIDIRGSFEADDEVGSVFTQLKALIEKYKN